MQSPNLQILNGVRTNDACTLLKKLMLLTLQLQILVLSLPAPQAKWL